MRAVSFLPSGLALLIVSLLLAEAMRFLPGLQRWSAQASWLTFWGFLTCTASTGAQLWSRSEASGARPDDLPAADQSLKTAAGNVWGVWQFGITPIVSASVRPTLQTCPFGKPLGDRWP